MNFKQAFIMSVRSLWTNKMRSFLTMLGIIIGVGSVIMLVGIVEGSTATITDSISEMGTNMLTVSLRRTFNSNRTLDYDDLEQFVYENENLYKGVTPVVSTSGTCKVGTTDVSSTLTGANEIYETVANKPLQAGRFVTSIDCSRRQKVAVIGTYLVNELFAGENPVGKTMRINGHTFNIIGVLEEKGDSTETSVDNAVIIPYTVAGRLFSNNMNMTSFYVEAADADKVDSGVSKLKEFLYGIYNDENAYSVSSMDAVIEILDTIMGTMSTMLAGIAAISLLVGGIGIMNIMLVSVTERTREIGIRKAIGAKRLSVLTQFLIESIVVSAIGGVIGIAVGLGGAYAITRALDIGYAVSVGAVIGSFAFSVAIGVFFGYYPANKASKLNPIDALRYE